MRLAWGRTEGATPVRGLHVLIAGLVAWIAPLVLGCVLMTGGNVLAPVDGGLSVTVGLILIYAPILSWAGLLPGILLHWLSWRQGAGGLATCLLIASILGLFISNALGPLALILSVPVAAIYWFVLRWLNPNSLLPAPPSRNH